MQMCLLCPKVALDGFRHVQFEETAEIKRLQRAQRVAISHAYSHALKTFQVLSPPSMRLLYSAYCLCRARRAVTLCARTYRLTRARRVAVSPAYSQALITFQVLTPSFMLPYGCNKKLCRAARAVTHCARTYRLTRARRVAVSPAHPQACKTFQVLSPPFKLPQGSYKQLRRALRAVTRCARTHRLKQARRVGISQANHKPAKESSTGLTLQ